MNRRRFLSFIGLAPVAAALPAMALPRPDNVKDTVKGSVRMSHQMMHEGGLVAGPSGQAVIIKTDYAISRQDYQRVQDLIKEIHRIAPQSVTMQRDIHERIEGDSIIRKGGERRYTVTL